MRHLLYITMALAVAAFVGCGSERTPESAGASSTGGAVVSTGGVDLAGDGPIDTVVAIDATAVQGDNTMAAAYKASALAAAEPTITRGGRLQLRLFGRVSGRAMSIHDEQVPDRTVAGKDVRGAGDQARRKGVADALNVALGLAPAPAVVAEQLKRVTSAPGSDIARAVGTTINDAGAGGLAVVITDGLVDEGGITARSLFAGGSPAALGSSIAEIAQVDNNARATMLRIAGIGATGGRLDLASADAERLVEMWTSACRKLPAETCNIQQAF